MELTKAQYQRSSRCPAVTTRQRHSVEPASAQGHSLCGRTWLLLRDLLARFGNWHNIWTWMNRRSKKGKKGVLDRVFENLQREKILRVKLKVLSIDSTVVKVHPDGTRALKKPPVHRQVSRGLDQQNSSGRLGWWNGSKSVAIPRTGSRLPGRTEASTGPGSPEPDPGFGGGPGLSR